MTRHSSVPRFDVLHEVEAMYVLQGHSRIFRSNHVTAGVRRCVQCMTTDEACLQQSAASLLQVHKQRGRCFSRPVTYQACRHLPEVTLTASTSILLTVFMFRYCLGHGTVTVC